MLRFHQCLQCPYVTRFLETAKDDTSLYIVMEAALGGPLHRHIQLHGNLPVSHAQIYLAQLVSCCEHMAKHGCIHRGTFSCFELNYIFAINGLYIRHDFSSISKI